MSDKPTSTFGKHEYLEVDDEFRRLIPAMSKEEFDQLEKNILAEGMIREPIDIWDRIVVDGMNRLKVARKHDMAFHVRRREFRDNDHARLWMLTNQAGRRNMTPEGLALIRGEIYNLRKKAEGERDENGKFTANKPLSQNEYAAQAVAKEHGVSASTIQRDAKFADDVGKLAPEVASAVVNAEVKGTRKAVAELAKKSPEKQKAAVEAVKSGKAKKLDDVVKPAKNGAVKGGWGAKDDAKVVSMLGQIARMVDDRKRAVGPSPSHQKILNSLNAALVEFKTWQKAKVSA